MKSALTAGVLPTQRSQRSSGNLAPSGRETSHVVRRKAESLAAAPILAAVLEAMPVMAAVLNGQRQIVAANHALLDLIGQDLAEILEKRPGEAIGCAFATCGPDGCGSALQCTVCGAVQSILESQRAGRQVTRECRVRVKTPAGLAALDLRVTASPLVIAGERYVLLALEDISQAKRLAVLQRSFFHDVLNTASCIQGWVQWLKRTASGESIVLEKLAGLTRQLTDEIGAQRELVTAEAGELSTVREHIEPRELLDELRCEWQAHALAADRAIVVADVAAGLLHVDRVLAKRVLGNMIKNALEAIAPGGTVTLRCVDAGERLALCVHNSGVMDAEVQLQVFQRSFSTKGVSGRGVGTHSMKLLGERYLGGEVDFESFPPEGTTFRLVLPKVAA